MKIKLLIYLIIATTSYGSGSRDYESFKSPGSAEYSQFEFFLKVQLKVFRRNLRTSAINNLVECPVCKKTVDVDKGHYHTI
ncbi:hypothetical protein A3F66_03420 [candidate division TM6 bacterium RIFCSPHIGHO2_12_FULL_32_22]|nr:MAG: hypothetical protein A3F66_03420 [candidate division TM6 bacterium RIFCSPHIGHO2_12_FULL_32_22]